MSDDIRFRHEELVKDAVNCFCEKYGLTFDYWLHDHIGGTASFNGEMFVKYQFIISDVIGIFFDNRYLRQQI